MAIFGRRYPDIRNFQDLLQAYRKEVLYRRWKIGLGGFVFLIAIGFFCSINRTFMFKIVFIYFAVAVPSMIFSWFKSFRLPRTKVCSDRVPPKSIVDVKKMQEEVDAMAIKMGTKLKFQVKIIPNKNIAAMTILSKIVTTRKRLILIYEGLLHILQENEVRAVIAHEIGHHFGPGNISNWLGEYWADYYACKYYDPVALGNALLKLDENLFLYSVYFHRVAMYAAYVIPNYLSNKAFLDFMMKESRLPFRSKRDACRQAKRVVFNYYKKQNIDSRRGVLRRKMLQLKNTFSRPARKDRKKLAERLFVEWREYDCRLPNHYLDRYEMMNLYPKLDNEQVTVARHHYLDLENDLHPNTNRRLRFIIGNFLLLDADVESAEGSF